ncbi:MAG: SGNH/GDSL hydrolase family protein [Acidimicrobiia bacterium]
MAPLATDAGPVPTEPRRSDPFPVPAVDGPGPVLVVGDSLTVGAESDGRLSARLSQGGWSPELVAVSGQSTRWGVEQVRLRAQVPEVVVVELGTNPWSTVGTFPADVEAMLDALEARGARAVVWVTPVAGDGTGRYDDKAEVLYDAAAEHPSLVVADWRPVAGSHPEWFRSDGLHYTDEGNAGLARFMTDAVGSLVS